MKFSFTATGLRILALFLMLLDHVGRVLFPGQLWMVCLGRLAFPIFAFQTAEGYGHTRNFRRYCLRLAVFALISEIPFNLALGSSLFYPLHQNVLWSFLLSLGLIHWNEKAKTAPLWRRILRGAGSVILGALAGTVTFVDYSGAGVLMVLVFYFFRKRTWWCLLGQLCALYYINVEMLSGLSYQVEILGKTYFLVQQGLALLALIPIWLYRGRQGHHSRAFRWLCYGFYPAHMLLLALIKMM